MPGVELRRLSAQASSLRKVHGGGAFFLQVTDALLSALTTQMAPGEWQARPPSLSTR